jgi:predicted deacetylase
MRSLAVSIHDVSPLTREPVAAIIGRLAAAGVPRVSLLVIPDHHHRGNITADAAFCDWLRAQLAAGHEAVLHGYYHRRERRPGESVGTRFFTRFYTADEGEFFDIDYAAARELIARGGEELARATGQPPAGFIAPAWLLSGEAECAARDLGFAYTTRLKSFVDLARRREQATQSLCWSVRSGWRRTVSLAWNRFLFDRLQGNALMRISIHPPDLAHAAIWNQIERLATEALRDKRVPVTYREFLAGWY